MTEKIEEFDVIRLIVPLEGEDVFDHSVIHPLPVGSTGTAVHVFLDENGEPDAFETEFLIHSDSENFRSVQIPVKASQCVLHCKYKPVQDEPKSEKKESARAKKAREAKEFAEASKAFADAETVTKANIIIPGGTFVVGQPDLEVKRSAVKFARQDPPIANLTEIFLEGTPPEQAYGMPLDRAFMSAFDFVERIRVAKNNWPPKFDR